MATAHNPFTFNAQQIKALDQHLGRSGRQPRKNLAIVVGAVNYYAARGYDAVTSRDVADAIATLGLQDRWALSDDVKDDKGLQRSIGDLLGGLGLNLAKGTRVKAGNTYRIPAGGITPEYLKGKGYDPDAVLAQLTNLTPGVDQALVDAVHGHRVLTFRYEGDPSDAWRKFHPHCYAPAAGGDLLHGWFVSGPSSSGTPGTWHSFRVDRIERFSVSDNRFEVRDDFRRDDPRYQNHYAIV